MVLQNFHTEKNYLQTQQDVKIKYLSQSGLEQYTTTDHADVQATQAIQAFVDTLKDRIDKIKEKDTDIKMYATEEKKRKKRTILVDSDLGNFMEDE